jgi:hypothetical protein
VSPLRLSGAPCPRCGGQLLRFGPGQPRACLACGHEAQGQQDDRARYEAEQEARELMGGRRRSGHGAMHRGLRI